MTARKTKKRTVSSASGGSQNMVIFICEPRLHAEPSWRKAALNSAGNVGNVAAGIISNRNPEMQNLKASPDPIGEDSGMEVWQP